MIKTNTKFGAHLVQVLGVREKPNGVANMSARELRELLESEDEDVQYVDVREQHEWDVSRIKTATGSDAFRLLPMSQMEQWQGSIEDELDVDKKTVVLCHGGIRSMRVAQRLLMIGFSDVVNVTGGIDAYSSVDPTVPRY